MAQKKRQKGTTWNSSMSAPLPVLLVIAVLLGTMLATGLLLRFIFGETSSVTIGVISLAVAAVVWSGPCRGTDWVNIMRIPARRRGSVVLLSIAAALVAGIFGSAIPGSLGPKILMFSTALVVLNLLVGREVRRELSRPQGAAPQEPGTTTGVHDK